MAEDAKNLGADGSSPVRSGMRAVVGRLALVTRSVRPPSSSVPTPFAQAAAGQPTSLPTNSARLARPQTTPFGHPVAESPWGEEGAGDDCPVRTFPSQSGIRPQGTVPALPLCGSSSEITADQTQRFSSADLARLERLVGSLPESD